MIKIAPIPHREPMIDERGILKSVWADFFQKLFVRVGETNGFASSSFASGYQKLDSGIYIQWGVTGSYATGTTTTVTFPTEFPTGCLQVIASPQGNSASSTTATGHWGTGNYSTSAFDMYNRTSITLTFDYLAVGY